MQWYILFLVLFACYVKAIKEANSYGEKDDNKELTMENIDSYEDAKYFYKEFFAPERQKIINDLTSLRDEIQQEESMQKSKAVTYSRAGIVGGVLVLGGYLVAPLPSAVLTTCGAFVGMTSFVANLLYKDRKFNLLEKKIIHAVRSLEKYDRLCLEMNEYLLPLKRDIQLMQEKINAFQGKTIVDGGEVLKGFSILQIATILKKLELLNVKSLISQSDKLSELIKLGHLEIFSSIAKELASIPSEVLGAATVISIIGNIRSISLDEDDLKDYELGRLCTEAQKLDNVIVEIRYEEARFSRYFD